MLDPPRTAEGLVEPTRYWPEHDGYRDSFAEP